MISFYLITSYFFFIPSLSFSCTESRANSGDLKQTKLSFFLQILFGCPLNNNNTITTVFFFIVFTTQPSPYQQQQQQLRQQQPQQLLHSLIPNKYSLCT
jgi:hypothetical protein